MIAGQHPPLWHYVLPDAQAKGRFVTAVRVCGADCFSALESFPTWNAAIRAADDFNAGLMPTEAPEEATA